MLLELKSVRRREGSGKGYRQELIITDVLGGPHQGISEASLSAGSGFAEVTGNEYINERHPLVKGDNLTNTCTAR